MLKNDNAKEVVNNAEQVVDNGKIDSFKPTTKNNYPAIDLFKLIFSMLIVILHVVTYALENMAVNGSAPTGASGGFLFKYVLPVCYLIIRLGVPFFFIASSFFLFKKIKKEPENRKQIIKNYIKRIFFLFLFWFVLWSPFLVIKYLKSTLLWWQIILDILCNALMTGLFPTAWYLFASIYGVLFVDMLDRKKVSNIYILIICAILYILPCCASSYFHLFDNMAFGHFLKIVNSYVILYNSPLVGFVFIALGKILADKEEVAFKIKDIILLICSFCLLFVEIFLLNYFGITNGTDSLVMLPLVSYFLFKWILNMKIKERPFYRTARQFSTFLYVSHCLLLEIIFVVLNSCNINVFAGSYPLTPVLYVVIVSLSFALFCLFKHLSTKKHGKIFKYSF